MGAWSYLPVSELIDTRGLESLSRGCLHKISAPVCLDRCEPTIAQLVEHTTVNCRVMSANLICRIPFFFFFFSACWLHPPVNESVPSVARSAVCQPRLGLRAPFDLFASKMSDWSAGAQAYNRRKRLGGGLAAVSPGLGFAHATVPSPTLHHVSPPQPGQGAAVPSPQQHPAPAALPFLSLLDESSGRAPVLAAARRTPVTPGRPLTPRAGAAPPSGGPASRPLNFLRPSSAAKTTGGGARPAGDESSVDDPERWITVFGFHSSRAASVIREFSKFGSISQTRSAIQGNWLHIQYSSSYEARHALSYHAHLLFGDLMIGVVSGISPAPDATTSFVGSPLVGGISGPPSTVKRLDAAAVAQLGIKRTQPVAEDASESFLVAGTGARAGPEDVLLVSKRPRASSGFLAALRQFLLGPV